MQLSDNSKKQTQTMGDFKIIWTKSWLLKGNFINKNHDRRKKITSYAPLIFFLKKLILGEN